MFSYKYSIVIPIYNEKENIFNLLNEIFINIDNLNISFEIIIINDCSNDEFMDTYRKSKFNNNSKIFIISNKNNMGQSYSIRKGIENAKYENIITIDGDGQNDPSDIIKLVEYYENKKYCLVGGIRSKRKDNFLKIISSRIANYIRSFILKDNCLDTGCSLKVFKKKIFLDFAYFNGIHRFLPALFKAYGCNTIFIPVNHRYRKFGSSKYDNFGRAIKGIRDLFNVYFIIKKMKSNV